MNSKPDNTEMKEEEIIKQLQGLGAKRISVGNSFIFEFEWKGTRPEASPELLVSKEQLELLQRLGKGKIIGIKFEKGDNETDSRPRVTVI